MKLSKPFKFKQFTIQQDKSAMKIGTDGVMLGAWCSIDHRPESILDIGTGTGVIALQLAQRSDAELIDAVEIEDQAYEQAVENFEQSDWGDRLFCYHSSFDEFAKDFSEDGQTYDMIVSNPPFYSDEYESENLKRSKARFTSALNFDDLIDGVARLLSKTGIFSVVIPFKEEQGFVDAALNHDLFLNRICRVKGNPIAKVKRSLLEFSFENKKLIRENLTIETQRHQYTEDYIKLVRDFYLKM